jgi:hypothetical protein
MNAARSLKMKFKVMIGVIANAMAGLANPAGNIGEALDVLPDHKECGWHGLVVEDLQNLLSG